jgi:hypothetical protein
MDIRNRLNLHLGNRQEFATERDGRVLVLQASIDASESAGMLKPLNPISLRCVSDNLLV